MKKLLIICVSIFISFAFPLFSENYSPFEEFPTVESPVLKILDFENKMDGKSLPKWAMQFIQGDEYGMKETLGLGNDYYVMSIKTQGESLQEAQGKVYQNLGKQMYSLAEAITPLEKGDNIEQKIEKTIICLSNVSIKQTSTWVKVAEVLGEEIQDVYFEVYSVIYFPKAAIDAMLDY